MEKFRVLQFADNEGGAAGSEGGNEGGAGSESKPSFDDFLKDKENQAEFDRRVQKAINTAVSKEKSKWEALSNDKLSEAEKLAKMSNEEKANYRTAQLEKELAELKRQNAKAELTSTARKMLEEEKINVGEELLAALVTDDAETTKSAIESFASLYHEAVEQAMKDALKGAPPKAGGAKPTMSKADILKVQDRRERQKLINENIELFEGGK